MRSRLRAGRRASDRTRRHADGPQRCQGVAGLFLNGTSCGVRQGGNMIRRVVLVAAAIVAAFAASAYGNAGEPIRIGVALSQTGNLADSAAPYFKGLDLWREQANARGGLGGRPVEFVVYDDRSDPATAARLYERLITNDKVDLVVSSLGSATAATGSAVAEKHKVVMINGGGAAEAIQQRGFKYVFQTAARISSYADGIV